MRKIIGHKNIIDGINKRYLNSSFSHANLITGEDGIGKSLIGMYLANKIMGKDDQTECVDIIKCYPSGTSFGVDDIRNIIEEVNKKPYEGDKKVLILYNCEKLTQQAQNAFLKTIEEPPKGVYLILLSDSLDTILDTIQSRCQIYKLTPLSKDEILEYINISYRDINMEDKQSALAYSIGIPGKVDKFLNDDNLGRLRDIGINLFKDLLNKEEGIVLKYQNLLKDSKNEVNDLINIFLSYVRDIMILKELNNEELIVNSDKIESIRVIARGMSYKRLNNMLEYIKEATLNISSNTNYSMTISVLLMGFVEV